MKDFRFRILAGVLTMLLALCSCRKDFSCEDCNGSNKPPIAFAGPDQSLPAGIDSVLLDGSKSEDPDGEIRSWEWKKVSGPSSAEITDKNKTATSVRKLSTGSYQFELKVTDDKGMTDLDTLEIHVAVIDVNHPPIADAGIDQLILLPVSVTDLDGSRSSDPDGNIAKYQWRNLNPSMPAVIISSNSMVTGVTDLKKGRYEFELMVEDAFGLRSLDTLAINVNNIVYQGCDSVPRELIHATLKEVGSFSDNRTGLYAVVSSGSKIFIAGGLKWGGGLSSKVDIYDTKTNSWTSTELSIPRSQLAAVSVGDKIVFAGGGVSGDVFSSNTTDRVDIYDLSTSSWSTASLSKSRATMSAAVAGNIAVFAGGAIYPSGSGGETLQIDIYDASLDKWSSTSLAARTEKSSLGICPTVWNNKIYLAGSVGNWFAWDFGGDYSNTINIYDVGQKQWTISSLTNFKGLMGGITVNNKTYYAGGIDNGFGQQTYLPVNTVEIHDLQTGMVTFSCLSNPVIRPDIVQHGSELVFFTSRSTQSGWVPNGVETNIFDIHDLNTGKWKVGKLPVNIYDAHMVQIGNKIFIVGGVVNGQSSSKIWELEY